MILRGLSPTVLLAGLGVLAAVLLVLHLLRVRLRRETVDSLLFFRMLGQVQRPRMLFGLPSRWLAFVLALIASALLWGAAADPRLVPARPSRIVLIDSTAAAVAVADDGRPLRDHYADRAVAMCDEADLGPRGRVVAFGGGDPTTGVRTVLDAGEPSALLEQRLRDLDVAGPPDTLWAALRSAVADLTPDDEVVVIGGPTVLPAAFDGVPVRHGGVATGRLETVGIARARFVPGEPTTLEVELLRDADAPIEVTLDFEGATPVTAHVPQASDDRSVPVRFDGLPLRAATGTLTVRVGVAPPRTAHIVLPDREPIAVFVAEDVPRAVHVLVEADERLALAPSRAAARIACTPGVPDAELPSLVITPGVGDPVARRPRDTRLAPDLPLSLRDRAHDGTALPDDEAWDAVWLEDALTGAPLLAGRGATEIHVVDWLLDSPTHRDVPLLLGWTLRRLGHVDDTVRIDVAQAAIASGAPPLDPADDAPRPGPPAIPAILLGLALLLVAADAWLHARGRLP
ncbi:MAG: hypothetical protein IPM29_06620 [Planctomycetes bacterium]|nr:hypothetical protein [Planctomycetota bacterium]